MAEFSIIAITSGNCKADLSKIMFSSINSLNKKMSQRRVLMPFVGALALLLVFLQSTELAHTHADVAQQVQCEVCVKAGAGDDLIAANTIKLTFAPVGQSYLATTLQFVPFLAPSSAKSRAPPQA